MMFETFSETIRHSQGGEECLKRWTESVEAWEKRRFSKVPVTNPYVPTVKHESKFFLENGLV